MESTELKRRGAEERICCQITEISQMDGVETRDVVRNGAASPKGEMARVQDKVNRGGGEGSSKLKQEMQS
jgi:hypothetical protein